MPTHFDHHYSAQTEFGKPLVDSTFTVALVTGQSVTEISQNVMANLGWDEIRLPNPVFEGNTIYSQSEVLEKRESRPNVGIVTVKTTGYNQDGKVGRHVQTDDHGVQAGPTDRPPYARRREVTVATTGTTRELVSFLSTLRFEDLPRTDLGDLLPGV